MFLSCQKKAADLVDTASHSNSTNPTVDPLTALLGPDHPGHLRAMGRNIGKTKLACFQVKKQFMAEMAEKQYHLENKVCELQSELARLKKQQEAEIGENSATARGRVCVNKRAQPKCVLVDWSGSDENVAEGRIISSESEDFVNDIPLGPLAVKVLVETAIKSDAFLWRPATGMFIVEHAAQPAKSATCSASPGSKSSNHSPKSNLNKAQTPSPLRRSQRQIQNEAPKENQKCKLMSIIGKRQVVAEGRWASDNPDITVHFVPLGPNGVKVWIDVVKVNKAEVWRPSDEIESMGDALGTCIAWPKEKVIFC
ncbi:hypothetical protein Bca4012_090229 [Brassica carinata]